MELKMPKDVPVELIKEYETSLYERMDGQHDDVLSAMERLRVACDAMEGIVSTELWPLPTYNKILFYC